MRIVTIGNKIWWNEIHFTTTNMTLINSRQGKKKHKLCKKKKNTFHRSVLVSLYSMAYEMRIPNQVTWGSISFQYPIS